MSEIVILDEMLEAGIEALLECQGRPLTASEVVIQVYSAMEAVKAVAIMNADKSVH